VADFRRPGGPYDPAFTQLTLAVGEDETVDLWGGGPPPDYKPLQLPELDDASLAEVVEITKDQPPGDGRRRFRLRGKAKGSTRLTARTGPGGAPYAALGVEVEGAHGQGFIARLAAEGAATARKYKLPPSLMIAQACLESEYGRHPRAQAHNTLFGIAKRSELIDKKEPDWYPRCQVILRSPTEVQDKNPDGTPKVDPQTGKAVMKKVYDTFCAASSLQEAVEIWAQYVTGHPRSKGRPQLFKGAPWSDQELSDLANLMPALNFGHPAEQATYGPRLIQIINDNRLKRYDAP
jgi:hypothetical protein